MIINNFQTLTGNILRKKALLIAEAGYQAIDIKKIVSERIKLKNNILEIRSSKIDSLNLNNFKRVFIVGIGKGSALASMTLAKILNRRLNEGIALDIQSPRGLTRIGLASRATRIDADKKLKFFIGTHPLPSKQNVKATQKIIRLVKNLKKDDLLITFICGGGSALLCASEKELKNSILATKLLTQAGADIKELNTVRKHLSEIKGGGLAKMAYPATVISLIVSDVPTANNDLSMVASGPTVYDKTTKKDAEKILKTYNLQSTTYNLKETPKDKKYFRKVKNILFLSNREPILAMAEKTKELGFKPKIYSFKIKGEAKNVLIPLIKNLKDKGVVLTGGETIVRLKKLEMRNEKLGKGGRNMEAVLAALTWINADCYIDKRGYNQRKSASRSAKICVLAIASDGRDNTEAAGAIADISTIQKAKKLKLNPQEFLNNHNSFNFFKKIGDLIFVKPKTFNVADLMIILKEK
jgi:glycerate 2-kinase